MQTMIEKIARNLVDGQFGGTITWADPRGFKIAAEYALRALLEPTESMIDAAPNWDCEECDGLGYSLTKEIFQKMIQAALDGK